MLTFDVDWSPDWMLIELHEILKAKNIKSTWFFTHTSPVIEVIAKSELVEVGIHPNFLPNSTHGTSVEQVMTHMKEQFPQAEVMRTHGLYTSSRLLRDVCEKYDIKFDSSIFLRNAPVGVYQQWFDEKYIYRIPFGWADDIFISEVLNSKVGKFTNPSKLDIVYDFHPFHIFLNTSTLKQYELCKNRRPISQWNRDFVLEYRSTGSGIRQSFDSIIEYVSDSGRSDFLTAAKYAG